MEEKKLVAEWLAKLPEDDDLYVNSFLELVSRKTLARCNVGPFSQMREKEREAEIAKA